MKLDGYQFQGRIGAGRDGVSFRAVRSADSTDVEIHDLSAARADPVRWSQLTHRLRLASRFDHECASRLLDLNLSHEPPFVVSEWVVAETLAIRHRAGLALPSSQALALCRTLAGLIADAHKVGLVHGRIEPSRVKIVAGGCPKLDFSGIVTTSTTRPGAFHVPEDVEEPDRAVDIFALGTLFLWLFSDDPFVLENEPDLSELDAIIHAMRSLEASERPTAREVASRLSQADDQTTGFAPPLPNSTSSASFAWQGMTLGRFRLLELLGEGGQGVVYRALDTADGSMVALKTLRPEWARRPEVLRRFRKEARLLSLVNNPYVVNLLEQNEDDDIAYFVMEYVTGQNLRDVLEIRGPLDEPTALVIAADVARALEDAHARGIVHRDVKPANILFMESAESAQPRVKLSDFGLARNIVDTESMALTEPGTVLGTPYYMAPEQWTGRPVDSRTDVYALGVTLFHMLSGRVPFQAESRERLLSMHCHDAPPSLRKLNLDVSDGVSQVVDRALAKAPEDRYPDASALLRDLERLSRGEPNDIQLHPILPRENLENLRVFEFRWELESTPRQLWPLVTNTDRLDRALGFPHVRYTYRTDPVRGVRQFAEGRKAGMVESWEEFPYEWIEPRRMGVLREYASGPFHWLVSTVELLPGASGGTTLIHTLRLEPRGWASRMFSPWGVGVKFRQTLEKVYKRIDATLMGKLGPPSTVDPFEPPPALSPALRERLERRLDALSAHGVDPAGIDRLGDLLAKGSAQDVARIRPIEIAGRWGLESEAALDVCLRAVGEGLLILLWDLLCPKCRLSCEVVDTLRAIREHGHCQACQLDFELDFAACVELIFRAHPEVREADTGLYCSGGPAHAPHVPARVRVAPGERVELELVLPEGSYRLGGPQLPWSSRFKVRPGAINRRLDLNLLTGPSVDRLPVLAPGGQVVVVFNPNEGERVLQVERESSRDDALTAAKALTFPLFRELFPGETLSPGQLCNVASVTLLVTNLAPSGKEGESHAFTVIYEHFRILDDAIRRAGGTLVKTIDEGIVASFRSSEDAIRLALELPAALAANEVTRHLRLRIGAHCGPAYIASFAGRLDYFGETSRRTLRLLTHASSGELILTGEIANDPFVKPILDDRGLKATMFDAGADGFLQRYALG